MTSVEPLTLTLSFLGRFLNYGGRVWYVFGMGVILKGSRQRKEHSYEVIAHILLDKNFNLLQNNLPAFFYQPNTSGINILYIVYAKWHKQCIFCPRFFPMGFCICLEFGLQTNIMYRWFSFDRQIPWSIRMSFLVCQVILYTPGMILLHLSFPA